MNRPARAAVALACLVAAAVAAETWRTRPVATTAGDFAHWRAAHGVEAAAYLDYLRRHDVASVLPEAELFRRGRRWEACAGGAYAVPPRDRWANVVPTLRLLRDLRTQGLIDAAKVVSGFRAPDFNRCEGGSSGSRHLRNQAFDLDWGTGRAPVARLCKAWRSQGPHRAWGLGFYTPARIHVDTAGFRTWGRDYHAASSLCLRADPLPGGPAG